MKRVKLGWMKYYVGDWAKLTAAMSIAERGAYQRLVEHYWTSGNLPSDEGAIARIARATPDEWNRVSAAVLSMFEFDAQASVWRCESLDDLRQQSEKEYQQQVEAGKRGVEVRAARRRAAQGQVNVIQYPQPNGQGLAPGVPLKGAVEESQSESESKYQRG